jgi:hypothetical protein
MKTSNNEQESIGLGDTVAKITHALKLDEITAYVAELLGQEDCGCTRRKEKLNQLFPYKKQETEK